jgi:signal transduction histidine kinase/CheY-like chemotaxis protein
MDGVRVNTTDRPVAKLRRLFLHRSVPYVVFAIGCTLALAAYWFVASSAAAAAELRTRSEFLADARQLRRQIETGVNSYIEVVRAAAVLLSSETELNGAEFSRFVNRLQLKERYPAIDGIGFAQCVPQGDVARMLRALALDGDPVRVWPDTGAAERCPVVFFDPPSQGNRRLRGFDLASEVRTRQAMIAARDSGQPAVSRQLDRTANTRTGGNLFVFIPVYRTASAATVEVRRRTMFGFVFSPLNSERLFEHIVELTDPALAFEIFEDPAETSAGVAIGVSSPASEPVRYESSELVHVNGRDWVVNVKSLGGQAAVVPEEARRALLGGTLISFMLFLITRAQARAWETAARHEAELRTSAEALKEREAQASAANRAKDEFLATLSHELRTPLNVVLGWVGMLRLGALNPARASEALEIIDRNARQQAELIDDLLDVSRIITGKLRLSLRTMEFGPTVNAVAESLRPSAEVKGVTLQVGPVAEPSTVMGDPDRLRQTVWNLLSNALKFTPPGGSVSVDLTSEHRQLRLTVRDTGVGISPDFLPYVFERFMQADSTTTRTHSGVGLGLAIVRELVELHGGTVQAESGGLNQGAAFVITLPTVAASMQPATPAARTRSLAPRLEGVRVLVVEDDPNTLEMLTEALETGGAQVTAVSSARRALDSLDAARPDVIVSDIAMPGEDGLWLMRRLRTLPGRTGRTPAIALTALARMEDRTRALTAGFQMHLAKPIRVDELRNVVATLAAEYASRSDSGRVTAC